MCERWGYKFGLDLILGKFRVGGGGGGGRRRLFGLFCVFVFQGWIKIDF